VPAPRPPPCGGHSILITSAASQASIWRLDLSGLLIGGLSIPEIARLLRRDHSEVRDKVVEIGRACRGSPASTTSEPAKVFEDRQSPGDWRVEKLDDDEGVEVAIFGGPNARRRAIACCPARSAPHPTILWRCSRPSDHPRCRGFEPLVPLRNWCRPRGPNDQVSMPHISERPHSRRTLRGRSGKNAGRATLRWTALIEGSQVRSSEPR
jgi:hypothetical protein